MKRPATPVTPETACEWLREQVAALDPCRNASPRDPQFKEWRQSTLTVVQRIWAGDTSRSRRFRRIPFRPPSTLADARQTREIFERGCAEASLLLKAWITEIEEQGVQVEVPEPHAETGIDQNAGNVELSASGPVNAKNARPERGRATERPKKSKKSGAKQPRLKDMLGFGDLAAAGGGRDAWKLPPSVDAPPTVDSTPVESPSMPAAPPPVAASDWPAPVTSVAKVAHEEILDPPLVIEVVGLDDSSDDASTRQASWIEPPILEARRKGPAELGGSPPASAPHASHESAAPHSPHELSAPHASHEPAAPPAPHELSAPTPFGEMSSPDRLDIADLELTVVHEVEPAAFTPAVPAVFTPAPPAAAEPPLSVPTDVEGVAEIFALAAEVDRYDVPAGECDRVRGVLLDLAHSIGSGRNSWDALRAATVIVMHYPRFGRRAMPVLMPFLGRAA